MRRHGDPKRDYAGEWKSWRKKYVLTQEQMASVLWMSRRQIINIEQGNNRPNQTSRQKMADLKKRYEEAQGVECLLSHSH